MSNYKVIYSDELEHFGIKGMKWGVRRFQNEDGSYTDAGKKRRGIFGDVKDKYNKYRKKRKRNKKIANELREERRKLQEKADKKYDIKYRERMKDAEDETRRRFEELGFDTNNDWHPASDKYDEAVSKRDAEVSKKLVKKYGQKKYDIMVAEDNRDLAIGLAAVGGIVAAAAVLNWRKY